MRESSPTGELRQLEAPNVNTLTDDHVSHAKFTTYAEAPSIDHSTANLDTDRHVLRDVDTKSGFQ